MLGRLAFTSFLSMRSRRGFSLGSLRFGFWGCDSVILNAFTIFLPIHHSQKLLTRLVCSPPPANVPQHLYGAVRAQSHAGGARRFSARTPLAAGQKCGMRRSSVDRALFSS